MKAIQITEEVYKDLIQGKKTFIQVLEQEGNIEMVEMVKPLGIGAFAGFLIMREIGKIKGG